MSNCIYICKVHLHVYNLSTHRLFVGSIILSTFLADQQPPTTQIQGMVNGDLNAENYYSIISVCESFCTLLLKPDLTNVQHSFSGKKKCQRHPF